MNKKIIICVDDEVIILLALKYELELSTIGDEYIIENSDSPKEVMELIEKFRNDLDIVEMLITDFNMPSMTGEELVIKIRDKYPEIKTVMISGFNHAMESIVDLRKKGYLDCFVSKPWNSVELIDTIRGTLKPKGNDDVSDNERKK